MAFTTEELIQIGLIIAIIIVFGYAAYNYLKNKKILEKLMQKNEKTEKPAKSLSFAKNRKMRSLEKLIPDKQLSAKPSLTELKVEGTEGLWEAEEEPFLEKKIQQKTQPEITETIKKDLIKKPEIKSESLKPKTVIPETKTEEKTKFPEIKQPEVKEKTEKKIKSILEEIALKVKTEKKPAAEAFALPEEKTDDLTVARKLEEKIKSYQEKAKPKTLFESQKEKEKHEQKFVQKILESEGEELEKISRAISPGTGKDWQKEKEETINSLKKEFKEIDETEKKDLWKKTATEDKTKKEKTKQSFFSLFKRKTKPEKKEKPEKKPEIKKETLEPKIKENKDKFKKEKELIKPAELTAEKRKPAGSSEEFNAEMKKLLEEQQKAIGIKPKKFLNKKDISAEDIEASKKETEPEKEKIPLKQEIKKELPEQEEKKEFKPEIKPKKEPEKKKKHEVKPKKSFFERIGLKKEKINLSKEEENQLQKVMIVLKGKTSEYSKEDMKQAMQNLGYNEKIIEEAIRRLY